MSRPMIDLISRQAAIEAIITLWANKPFGNPALTEIKECVERVPSAQPDGWLEQNKDKILQAGMEGREIDFHIGGRLFAIREKAQ